MNGSFCEKIIFLFNGKHWLNRSKRVLWNASILLLTVGTLFRKLQSNCSNNHNFPIDLKIREYSFWHFTQLKKDEHRNTQRWQLGLVYRSSPALAGTPNLVFLLILCSASGFPLSHGLSHTKWSSYTHTKSHFEKSQVHTNCKQRTHGTLNKVCPQQLIWTKWCHSSARIKLQTKFQSSFMY